MAALMVLACTVALVWRAWNRPPEPSYQGRKISSWIEDLSQRTNVAESQAALQAMGPDAARFLIDQVRRLPDKPLIKESYRSLRRMMPYTLQAKLPAAGKNRDGQLREVARQLCLLAPQAPDVLLAATQDSAADVRFVASLSLHCLGAGATNAVPALSTLILDPEPRIRAEALRSLLLIQADRSPALPALLQIVRQAEDPQSASFQGMASAALSTIGLPAAEAAPSLRKLASSSNIWLSIHASAALWSVARDTNGLPQFIRELERTNANAGILRLTLQTLASMGPAAEPAVPAILGQFTNTTRPPSVQALRAEAIRTLRSIEPASAERLQRHAQAP